MLRCDAEVARGWHGRQSQKGGGAWQVERMRAAVLEEAHIVACTLSFAGSATFARMSRPFDVVVIDEAAQAVEPSVLVPLVNGCKQVERPHTLSQVISDDISDDKESIPGRCIPAVAQVILDSPQLIYHQGSVAVMRCRYMHQCHAV